MACVAGLAGIGSGEWAGAAKLAPLRRAAPRRRQRRARARGLTDAPPSKVAWCRRDGSGPSHRCSAATRGGGGGFASGFPRTRARCGEEANGNRTRDSLATHGARAHPACLREGVARSRLGQEVPGSRAGIDAVAHTVVIESSLNACVCFVRGRASLRRTMPIIDVPMIEGRTPEQEAASHSRVDRRCRARSRCPRAPASRAPPRALPPNTRNRRRRATELTKRG